MGTIHTSILMPTVLCLNSSFTLRLNGILDKNNPLKMFKFPACKLLFRNMQLWKNGQSNIERWWKYISVTDNQNNAELLVRPLSKSTKG